MSDTDIKKEKLILKNNMDKKFKRNKNKTTNISYGKIGQRTRKIDLEAETIKEKRNPDK